MNRILTVVLSLVLLVGCGDNFTTAPGIQDDPMGGASSETGGETFTSDRTGGSGGSSTGGSEPNAGGATPTGGQSTGGSTGGTDTGGTGGGTGGSSTGGQGTGGSGPDPECIPDQTQCDGKDAYTCDADGFWQHTKTCPYLCDINVGGFCHGVCEPGGKQCSVDGDAQECDEYGRWITRAFCPSVCTDGTCTGSCTPGTTQCAGDTVQTCNSEGAWENSTDCDYVCSSGACTGVCEPGATDCLGDVPRVCDALGQWVEGSECEFVCSSGSCTGSCEPGAVECDGAGTRTCGTDGTWGATSACPTSANENPTCSGGVCGTTCQDGYDDCTSAPGCESDLTATTTCGTCENVCDPDPDHAAPTCTETGCGFVCDEGWGDVNGLPGDGCEHDIYNDPENCGEPGKSCYGGSCTQGVCEFEGIEEVASGATSSFSTPAGMAADGGYVYMHMYDGSILKIKADGSESETVLDSGFSPQARDNVIVEDGNVFFVASGGMGEDPGIYKVSTSGGSATKLTGYAPSRFDVENSTVYWNDGPTAKSDFCTSSCTTYFRSVDVAGGSVSSTGKSGAYSAHIKVIGNSAFVVEYQYNSQYEVFGTISVTELNATTWAWVDGYAGTVDGRGLTHQFGDLAVTDDYVFTWSNEDDDISSGSYGAGIRRMDLSTRENTAVLYPAPSVGSNSEYKNLLADDSNVYYSQGGVKKVGINGGSVTSLTPHTAYALAQDSGYVYWATWSLGDSKTYILRLAK